MFQFFTHKNSRISLSEWTDFSGRDSVVSISVGMTEVERVRAFSDARGNMPNRQTFTSVVSNLSSEVDGPEEPQENETDFQGNISHI